MYCACLSESYDVIVLIETWLSPVINNNEILDSRYMIFRNDRNNTNNTKSDGGGVLIAVHKSFQGYQISLNCESVEQIFVKVYNSVCSFVIGAVYLPPTIGIDKYSSHVEVVTTICDNMPDCQFIILGDYNLPNIKWQSCDDNNDFIPSACAGKREECICDGFTLCNLLQFSNIKNNCGNVTYALLTVII